MAWLQLCRAYGAGNGDESKRGTLFEKSSFASDLLEQRVASLNNLIFQLQHVAQNFLGRIVVHGLGGHGLVTAGGEAPIVRFYFLNRHAVARSEERRVGKEGRSRWAPY